MNEKNIWLIKSISLIILLILNSLLFNIKNIYLFSIFLLLVIIITLKTTGYQKNRFIGKKYIGIYILIYIIIYFCITYFLGLYVGYYKNGYNLKLFKIIQNTFPYLIFIILREIYRYIEHSKNNKKILNIILGIIIFVLLDVNINLRQYNIFNTESIVKLILFIIIPSITKNILLTYLTIKAGYENTILYSIIMELNIFIFPIFPDLGDYINTVLITILPIIIFAIFYKKFNKNRIIIQDIKTKIPLYKKIINIIIYIILIIIIMLNSGYFKYTILTIGSGSMKKYLDIGDIVFIKKISSKEVNTLKKKDIIIYKKNNKIIVHRIVEIKNVNNELFYITKGDNNKEKDQWYVEQKEIIGVAKGRVKYLGLPSVEIEKLISK